MNDLDQMELRIAKFLRAGVIFAGAIMAIGWILTLTHSGGSLAHFRSYDPVPLQNFLLYHYNQDQWGHLLSYSGLVILISLPLLRVLFTGLLFIKQKEYLLAMTACLVLLGLLLSFSLGIEH